LVSDAAQKIDFWCNGIHVDGAGLYSVYKALLVNYMHVAIDHTMDPGMAQYSAADNTFYFAKTAFGNRDSTVAEKALTIHESVHAMIDLAFSKTEDWFVQMGTGGDSPALTRYHPLLTFMQDEAVAYVAQALFIVNAIGRQDYQEAVLILAMRIADRIKDNDGATVTDTEAADLQNAISQDPHYRHKLFWSQANG
jgi:hypothetical protein